MVLVGYTPLTPLLLKEENIMQWLKLLETIEDIDGFKDFCNNIILKIILKRRYCYGKRIKGKRVLQTGYC